MTWRLSVRKYNAYNSSAGKSWLSPLRNLTIYQGAHLVDVRAVGWAVTDPHLGTGAAGDALSRHASKYRGSSPVSDSDRRVTSPDRQAHLPRNTTKGGRRRPLKGDQPMADPADRFWGGGQLV